VRTACSLFRLEKSFILRRAAASGLHPARTTTSTSSWSAAYCDHKLRQAPVDSGVACACSTQHPGTACFSLSLLPLQSTHLKTDWIITGHYKNWNMIGKQNYQEPGVEAELNYELFEFYHYIF